MNAPLARVVQSTAEDPLWYKDAIIYQLHIKSFCDSNNDGVGDFPGLMSKLDYIAALGVNAIWLLPFYPSPRLDDGYDISDYRTIHPEYGTMGDFKRFVAAAHARTRSKNYAYQDWKAHRSGALRPGYLDNPA